MGMSCGVSVLHLHFLCLNSKIVFISCRNCFLLSKMKVSTSLAAAAFAVAAVSGAAGTPETNPKLSGEKLAELMQLSLSEIKNRMETIFSLVDTNADGQITAEEAQAWSARLKEAMHKHQVKQEFISIDKNNDGKITLEELEVTYTDGSDPASQEAHKVSVYGLVFRF